jgi:hypothetical protein
MFKFFRQFHHLPSCPEDCFVTLLLPEFDVEFTAGKTALDQPGFPVWFSVFGHRASCE